MKSKTKQREAKAERRKYTSARARAEKQGQGFVAPYLRVPDGATMFKAKEGTMLLDILPYVAGDNNPFAEKGVIHWERTYFAHRGIGANSDAHLCLRMPTESPPHGTGKGRCPVCEHRSKLLRSGDEDEEAIKDLSPKQRQLFNVIDRKAPEKGVQLWDVSYFLFGKMLDARIRNSDEDDQWGQFFFPEGGFTLKVTFVEKTFSGRTYLEAETIDFRKRREDYDEDEILAQTHNLDDCIVALSYDELKAKFLETEDDEAPPPKKTPAKSKKSPPPDDEDDEDEDEDEAPPPAKSKKTHAKSKKSPPPDDEDDDSDDSDDDEDEDDEAPPPKKGKGKKAPPPDDDEDDEDDSDDSDEDDDEDDSDDSDDDEDEDEDEDPPPAKSKKGGKKTPPPEDDEDDDDWDDDEDDDPPPAKSKKGKGSKNRR